MTQLADIPVNEDLILAHLKQQESFFSINWLGIYLLRDFPRGDWCCSFKICWLSAKNYLALCAHQKLVCDLGFHFFQCLWFQMTDVKNLHLCCRVLLLLYRVCGPWWCSTAGRHSAVSLKNFSAATHFNCGTARVICSHCWWLRCPVPQWQDYCYSTCVCSLSLNACYSQSYCSDEVMDLSAHWLDSLRNKSALNPPYWVHCRCSCFLYGSHRSRYPQNRSWYYHMSCGTGDLQLESKFMARLVSWLRLFLVWCAYLHFSL